MAQTTTGTRCFLRQLTDKSQTDPAETMQRKLLSVCIPTFNRPHLLLRTLQSVCVDSPQLEVIVTDNSHDDATEAAVRNFFEDSPLSWRYHRNNFDPDLPGFELMTRNMNAAARLAGGEFVYIIHDDDFAVAGGIQRLLRALNGKAAEFAVLKFGVQLVDIEGKVQRTERCLRSRYLPPKQALKGVLTDSSFARFPSIVFRRDVYAEVGNWDVGVKGPIDFDMYVRAFREFGVMEYRDLLGCYTVHDASQTMNMFNAAMVENMFSLFAGADPKKLLSERERRRAQASFIHQFLLGGTYRMLRWRRFADARAIYNLLNMPAVEALGTPAKWAPAKMLFGAWLSVLRGSPA